MHCLHLICCDDCKLWLMRPLLPHLLLSLAALFQKPLCPSGLEVPNTLLPAHSDLYQLYPFCSWTASFPSSTQSLNHLIFPCPLGFLSRGSLLLEEFCGFIKPSHLFESISIPSIRHHSQTERVAQRGEHVVVIPLSFFVAPVFRPSEHVLLWDQHCSLERSTVCGN